MILCRPNLAWKLLSGASSSTNRLRSAKGSLRLAVSSHNTFSNTNILGS